MRRFCMRLVCLMMACLTLCVTPAFAISNADTMRVFKRVVQNESFLPQLYSAVPFYEQLSITNESVNKKMKENIRIILTKAEREKEQGILTRENLRTRLQALTVDTALNMEAAYIALCTDAFSEETIKTLLNGIVPAEFQPLYLAIAEESYVILGFGKRLKPTHVFDDLAGYEWAEEAIAELFDRDIINGVSDFSFVPAATVTREQFAKMMCVAFSIEAAAEKPVFSDVLEQDWFYPYVTTMASQKLILGVGGGMFGSGQNITRQDMAVLMFRIGELLGLFDRSTSKTAGFDDERFIASYAKTAIITLKELGIIQGNELNCFNPTMSATRAEAAQMLYRCYQYANK